MRIMKRVIESYGVKLLQYIPFNCFIAKIDEAEKAIIEQRPCVNWVGNYEPAYKLSTTFTTRKNENRVRVQIFYFEDECLVKNKMQKLGCEILEVAVDQYVKIITVRASLNSLIFQQRGMKNV